MNTTTNTTYPACGCKLCRGEKWGRDGACRKTDSRPILLESRSTLEAAERAWARKGGE